MRFSALFSVSDDECVLSMWWLKSAQNPQFSLGDDVPITISTSDSDVYVTIYGRFIIGKAGKMTARFTIKCLLDFPAFGDKYELCLKIIGRQPSTKCNIDLQFVGF